MIVVAHPDDETLWCGGLPLTFPEKRWTAIACSVPRYDPERAEHFFDACAVLGVTAELLRESEGDPGRELPHLGSLDLGGYTALVTHGAAGEYGHVHHRQLHRVVLAARAGRPVVAIGFPGGAETLELSTELAKWKREALGCYRGRSAGSSLPKGEHLIQRYTCEGWRLERETYDLL